MTISCRGPLVRSLALFSLLSLVSVFACACGEGTVSGLVGDEDDEDQASREAQSVPAGVRGTINNAIYSWWIQPLEVNDGHRVFVGSIAALGTPRISRVELATGKVETIALDQRLDSDDHNAPALAFRETQRHLIAFWTRHGADNVMRYRTVNRDTLELGPLKRMTFSKSITYAQVIRDERTLMVLTRVTVSEWHYRLSRDWGESWTDERTLVDAKTQSLGQVYCIMKAFPRNANLNHLAFYGHPMNSQYRNANYATIRLDTGEILRPDGQVIGNINIEGGPRLQPTELEPAITPGNASKIRLLDVYSIDDSPALAYAVWDGDRDAETAAPATYKIKWYRNGQWSTMPWSLASGEPFGYCPATHYLGGVVIGYDDALYSAREAGGTWFVEQWRWLPSQSRFALVNELARSQQKLVRPRAPARSGGSGVVIQRLQTYGTSCNPGYTDYRSDILVY